MTQDKLLLDVGGTFIKCSDGRSVPIDSAGTRDEIVAALREAVADYKVVRASVPGPFDYDAGIFLMKHKFAAVYGEYFSDIVGVKDCKFAHDVNVMLLGELTSGAAQGSQNVALIALGTGLGFAMCVDGKVLKNENGSPLVSIYSRPYRDGVLEDYASKRGVLRLYRELCGEVGLGGGVGLCGEVGRGVGAGVGCGGGVGVGCGGAVCGGDSGGVGRGVGAGVGCGVGAGVGCGGAGAGELDTSLTVKDIADLAHGIDGGDGVGVGCGCDGRDGRGVGDMVVGSVVDRVGVGWVADGDVGREVDGKVNTANGYAGACAREAFARMGAIIGATIAPILKEYGIGSLLLGGQISRSYDLYMPTLQSELDKAGLTVTVGPISDFDNATFNGLKAL